MNNIKRTTEMVNHWGLTDHGDFYHCKSWSNKRKEESYQSAVRAEKKGSTPAARTVGSSEDVRGFILQTLSLPTSKLMLLPTPHPHLPNLTTAGGKAGRATIHKGIQSKAEKNEEWTGRVEIASISHDLVSALRGLHNKQAQCTIFKVCVQD